MYQNSFILSRQNCLSEKLLVFVTLPYMFCSRFQSCLR